MAVFFAQTAFSHVIYNIFEFDPDLMTPSLEQMIRHLNKQDLEPHIYEQIPLFEAARVHALLESRAVKGKIILKP